MPFGFELAPADASERDVAAEVLQRVQQPGSTIITDKGFAGADFEHLVLDLGCRLIRPDRRDEPHRHGTSAASANGSKPSSGPPKTNSAWNATAPAP
jgi:hypothetical protein